MFIFPASPPCREGGATLGCVQGSEEEALFISREEDARLPTTLDTRLLLRREKVLLKDQRTYSLLCLLALFCSPSEQSWDFTPSPSLCPGEVHFILTAQRKDAAPLLGSLHSGAAQIHDHALGAGDAALSTQ